MLTVFNGADGYPISNDNYYIRELASGLDEIVFEMSIRDPIYQYILEEARIRDRDENYYLIKQIDAGNDRAKVVCQIDIDAFKSAMYESYTNASDTVYNTVVSVLPAGWSCVDRSNITIRRTIPTGDTTTDYNVTAWKVLQDCCNVYKVRFRFDNVNRIVYILNPANFTNLGAFATRDLNLRELNYKGKSNDFCTRLYAEGADGMTFADINNGKNYVDDNTYSNKVISAYWKDERYTDMESLLSDARANLAEMAVPSRSYDCDVLDLASTNPEMYGFEEFSLFSIITLIDDARGERLNYQIVEKWNYPYYPVKNKVVLSTEVPKIQNQVLSIIEALNDPTSNYQQMMQSAIANSTALITGNRGGYVVFHDSNNDGTPDEILIMDTDDIETAMKVWRWNENGLGYSRSGYDGTFGLAMTIDGAIVADYITAGELNGGLIKAGTLSSEALTVEAREEFNVLHNYEPYDLFDNINRWEINAYQVNYGMLIWEGETIKTLELDGTGITEYTPSYQTQIKTDVVGKPEITIKYRFMFDSDIDNILQQFSYFYYWSSDDRSYHTESVQWLSGAYDSNRIYEREYTFTPQHTVSLETGYYPRFGFRFVPETGTSVMDLQMYGSEAGYKEANLQFDKNGLSATVQSGNIISNINQSAESVTIQASKINLTGDLSLRGDFVSYKPNDNTTYAFLDSGNLSFYNSGLNIFTVASTPLLGNKAGIFFGDKDDPSALADYTNITQDNIFTPNLVVNDTLNAETATIHQLIATTGDIGQVGCSSFTCRGTDLGTTTFLCAGEQIFEGFGIGTAHTQFYTTVLNQNGGTVFVSDKRKKKNIKDLAIDKAKSFIMALKPREFKFKKGISTSNRKHHGFIAQEVQEAMHEDWGLYVEDKDIDYIGLRYDELIADMVAVIQDQEKRIDALERKLEQ